MRKKRKDLAKLKLAGLRRVTLWVGFGLSHAYIGEHYGAELRTGFYRLRAGECERWLNDPKLEARSKVCPAHWPKNPPLKSTVLLDPSMLARRALELLRIDPGTGAALIAAKFKQVRKTRRMRLSEALLAGNTAVRLPKRFFPVDTDVFPSSPAVLRTAPRYRHSAVRHLMRSTS